MAAQTIQRVCRVALVTALVFALQPAGLPAPRTAVALTDGGYFPIAAWPDGDGAFASPGEVAVAPDGTVYVADTGNDRIKHLSSAGEVLGIWGSPGTGDGEFDRVEAIAVGPGGQVYVADTGNDRVQVFDADGAHLATWGRTGTAAGEFDTPMGIATDGAGAVYVSDTANGRIQKLDANGEHLLTIGSPGTQNGQLDGACGVAVDAAGYVYVADLNNRRVQKFSSAGVYVTQWGPVLGAGGEPTGSRYTAPTGIDVDGTGYVYVTDASEHQIERCTDTGASPTVWGSLGDAAGQLDSPRGVAVLPSGGVLVADSGNNRVETFTPGGVHVDSWSGRGSGVGELDSPGDVALGEGGITLVADTGNSRVQAIDANGLTVGGFGSAGASVGQFAAPRGIAARTFTSAGTTSTIVWIADTGNDRIQSTDPSGTAFLAYGAFGTAAGQFDAPEGIAVESSGSVLVADTGNDRVQRISATGSALSQWGSTGSGAGQFLEPAAVACGPDGSVYVVDRGNNRVQRFSAAGAPLTQWGSWGTDPGEFRSPQGIAVDSAGTVFVADAGNDRIQCFDAAGAYLYEFGTPGASLGGLAWPGGLEAGADGRIVLAERDNHRVQVWGCDLLAPVTSRSGTPSGWDTGYVTSAVTVTLAAADGDGSGVSATYYRLGAGAVTTYTAPFAIEAQGETLVRYWSVDRVGNAETVKSVRVRIDSVPPAGTFVLDGGASYATTTAVSGACAVTDALDMRFDTGGGYGAWEAFATARAFTLAGEGTRTVGAQFRDWLGNTLSLTDTIAVDWTAPVSTLEGVPPEWHSGVVTLSLHADDAVAGVDRLLVSEDGGPETLYAAPWTIAHEGTTTVTYRAIDNAGNAEETRTAVVLIDNVPPTGTLALDDGARFATSTAVTARSQVTDAVRMRFDTGGGAGFGEWVAFDQVSTLTLPGEGDRTVVAQYEDSAGLALQLNDAITVDLTAPGAPVFDVWEAYSPLPRFAGTRAGVAWEASDANGIAGYSWVIDRSPGTVPDMVAEDGAPYTRVDGRAYGTWYVHVRARDSAGLWGACAHVAVVLQPPLGWAPPSGGDTRASGGLAIPGDQGAAAGGSARSLAAAAAARVALAPAGSQAVDGSRVARTPAGSSAPTPVWRTRHAPGQPWRVRHSG